MTRVLLVAGARPNFVKVAPVLRALGAYPKFETKLVHTGQHYDDAMSKVFFEELGLPDPDIHLSAGPGTQARQTAKVMVAFEEVVAAQSPDLVVVAGDVNSTLACSLVVSKAVVPLAHVEAGLRSHDRSMPEEVNRLVTDSLAQILFTTSSDANENLLREGYPLESIHLVGNTMIDTSQSTKRPPGSVPFARSWAYRLAATSLSPCTGPPTWTARRSCGLSSGRSPKLPCLWSSRCTPARRRLPATPD